MLLEGPKKASRHVRMSGKGGFELPLKEGQLATVEYVEGLLAL
jgi:hypothetical protein